MGESTKTVCVLLMIVSAIIAALAWADDRPDAMTWQFRIGAPIIGIFALGLILKLHFRSDIEHDYLRNHFTNYFNRNGFCFAFHMTAIDGVAVLEIYFQGQHEKPCIGEIALCPAYGLFKPRAEIDVIKYKIACPPAGFGRVRIPLPISLLLQGKRQEFEVGASVRYPKGKGRRVRFQDGIFVRSNADFRSRLGTILRIFRVLSGSFLKPGADSITTTTLNFPINVANQRPERIRPEIQILWQLGEPPLTWHGTR